MLKGFRSRSMSKVEKTTGNVLPDEVVEQQSADGTGSSTSFERFCADIFGEGSAVGSPRDAFWDADDSSTSTSVESSPLGWPRGSKERSRLGRLHSLPRIINTRETSVWDEQRERVDSDLMSEVDMMKERFAKLLLGEDLSGGGKGVSSALAISNAITNLFAAVFGELGRLEPLAQDRKKVWCREMGWLLSVSDYIVEFVPSAQTMADGSKMEVMVTRQRSDLGDNLPALRQLETLLLEALDSFHHTEFWYMDRTAAVAEDGGNLNQRQEEKWWLPTPRVPTEGLSADARKQLQHQRDTVNQVLKAASATNAHMLSVMEVPAMYWEALPKNARSSLGDTLYRSITSEHFSPDALIASIDRSREHSLLELVNRVEAATYIWRRKLQSKHSQLPTRDGRGGPKVSWGGSGELERREVLEKAQSLLLLLKQKFPGLPQSILDTSKIQFNKDVGHAILESFSRVLETLAYNILSRVDDVLHVDDSAKSKFATLTRNPSSNRDSASNLLLSGVINGAQMHLSKSTSMHGPSAAPPPQLLQSKTTLSDFIGWNAKEDVADTNPEVEHLAKASHRVGSNKNWSYSGNLNTMRSPPSRD